MWLGIFCLLVFLIFQEKQKCFRQNPAESHSGVGSQGIPLCGGASSLRQEDPETQLGSAKRVVAMRAADFHKKTCCRVQICSKRLDCAGVCGDGGRGGLKLLFPLDQVLSFDKKILDPRLLSNDNCLGLSLCVCVCTTDPQCNARSCRCTNTTTSRSPIYKRRYCLQAPCTLDATRDATHKNGARSHFVACCLQCEQSCCYNRIFAS